MTVILRNLALPLDRDEGDLAGVVAQALAVNPDDLTIRTIVRKSLDARRRRQPRFLYTLALDLGPDTRLFLWTLGWDTHALVSHPLAIFDANIFYPEPRTLAYSEHQIGSALFAAPVILASGNLVLGLNLVLLFSCAASGGFTISASGCPTGLMRTT